MSRVLRVASSRTAAVVVALGLAVTLATGATFAATSASKGYSACTTSKAVLKLLTSNGKCPSGTKRVTVGAEGPAGPQGKQGVEGEQGQQGIQGGQGNQGVQGNQGPAGPDGAPGPSGVINARYFANEDSGTTLPTTDAPTTVGTIDNLAAGQWFISASLTALNPGSQATTLHLTCYLHLSVADPADDLSNPAKGTIIQDIFGDTIVSVSTQNAFTTTAASTVDLDCDSSGGPTVDNIRITAVPVSSYQ